MGSKIEENTYVIRTYFNEETYETLGLATGKNEEDAIEAFLSRKENEGETRELVADLCEEIDFGMKESR